MLLWLTVTTTIRKVEFLVLQLLRDIFRWSSPDLKRSGHPVLISRICANCLSKTGDYLNKFYADIQWLLVLLLVFVSKVYYLLRKIVLFSNAIV